MADYKTLAEFWPFYLGEHAHPVNRWLHAIGSLGVLGLVAATIATRQPLLLLAGPVVGYGFAWVGHFFVEKNKPASFKYPLWSFRADWVMWSKIIRRQMAAELERAEEIMAAREERAAHPGLHAVA